MDDEKWKLSSKGVQEKQNKLTPLDYIYTLHTQEPKLIENAGMIQDKQDLIHLYTQQKQGISYFCLLYTSPSPRDRTRSRMPSSA